MTNGITERRKQFVTILNRFSSNKNIECANTQMNNNECIQSVPKMSVTALPNRVGSPRRGGRGREMDAKGEIVTEKGAEKSNALKVKTQI